MEAARIGALEAWLTGALGAERVTISGPAKLSGGAIQENWALDLDVTGGPEAGRHEAVLRTDAPSGVAVSHSRVDEFTRAQLPECGNLRQDAVEHVFDSRWRGRQLSPRNPSQSGPDPRCVGSVMRAFRMPS